MDKPAFEDISAGTVILRENAVSDRVFLIDEGEVEVLRRVEGKFRKVRRLGPGDFFGELSLLEDLPSSDVVRAVSDCRLLTIGKDLLPHVLRENIDVALLMIRRLSVRAEENQQLTLSDEPTPESPTKEVTTEEPQGATSNPLETAVLPQIPPVESTTSPVASLVHEDSGTVLTLPEGDELTIGRLHIHCNPDIDLRLLDTQQSVSRLHAHISRRGGHLILWEDADRAPINGTFVGGERLPAGQEHTLADGDELRFGTLPLVFRITGPTEQPGPPHE